MNEMNEMPLSAAEINVGTARDIDAPLSTISVQKRRESVPSRRRRSDICVATAE